MWSKGTDMVQADTPAFALHLWTRVQPLVSARDVAKIGASKPWETVALACLWLAAKHEEARRALPPASRCAARSCTFYTAWQLWPAVHSDTMWLIGAARLIWAGDLTRSAPQVQS